MGYSLLFTCPPLHIHSFISSLQRFIPLWSGCQWCSDHHISITVSWMNGCDSRTKWNSMSSTVIIYLHTTDLSNNNCRVNRFGACDWWSYIWGRGLSQVHYVIIGWRLFYTMCVKTFLQKLYSMFGDDVSGIYVKSILVACLLASGLFHHQWLVSSPVTCHHQWLVLSPLACLITSLLSHHQ